jgi:uncharacterized protein
VADSETGTSLIIPPKFGRAFEVLQGQRFRIVQVEGEQVADMTLFNLRDHSERMSAPVTCSQNQRYMTRVETLWSGPPHLRRIAAITGDTYKRHWMHGRCTALTYRTHDHIESPRSCQLNICEAVAPFGIVERDVPFDTMNVFMEVDLTPEGQYVFRETRAKKDDFIELTADIDLLVAISNCPGDNIVNNYSCKPLRVDMLKPGD